jgi:hypothetical protein
MSQLYSVIVGIFRMARYGAADEFTDAEESKEREVHAIPRISDKQRKEVLAKSQDLSSATTDSN